jgi:hypothetical protein
VTPLACTMTTLVITHSRDLCLYLQLTRVLLARSLRLYMQLDPTSHNIN